MIPEPMGGAHRAPEETIDSVGKVISDALTQLSNLDPDTLRRQLGETVAGHDARGDGEREQSAAMQPRASF